MKKNNFIVDIFVHIFTIINIVKDRILSSIFVYRNKQVIKVCDAQSYDILLKGLSKYPKSALLLRELIKLDTVNQNWEQAVMNWEKLFSLTSRPLIVDYINYSTVLQQSGNASKAMRVLQGGLTDYPNNLSIVNHLIELSEMQSDWDNIILYSELWDTLPKEDNTFFAYDNYISLYKAYKLAGILDKAESTLDKASSSFPQKKVELYDYYAELFILQKDWPRAVHQYERNVSENSSFDTQITLAMLHKIVGNQTQFESMFKQTIDRNKEKINDDSLGYRKLILFDNGETRIEFYKRLEITESVIITFDAINMTWDKPSFAFKLLQKENLDIIAIRKRRARTYQQDFHQDDFIKTVEPLLIGYRDKMAYGFSLGAYHTLYFASLLDCRILSISPRLSIHPEYGRTKIIPKHKMQHQLNFTTNNKIAPIIVYDPKNALDRNYIMNGVIPFFPNAIIVNIPYGGHGIAPHLLKMGQLKTFVYAFLRNEVPVYNRKLKVKSPVYFKNLGNECLKHNKFKWALDLANRSLELEPVDKGAMKLKLKVLKKIGELEEARIFAIDSIKLIPNNLDLRLYLVDIYIELNEFEKAKKALKQNEEKFGKSYSITKRMKKLKQQ